jgi:hypothetical protein
MLDTTELVLNPKSDEYTDFEVDENDKDALDNLFGKDDQNDSHFSFLHKVQTKALEEIQADEDQNIPEEPNNLDKLRFAEDRAATAIKAPVSGMNAVFNERGQVIEADASDGPWKVVEEKATKSN